MMLSCQKHVRKSFIHEFKINNLEALTTTQDILKLILTNHEPLVYITPGITWSASLNCWPNSMVQLFGSLCGFTYRLNQFLILDRRKTLISYIIFQNVLDLCSQSSNNAYIYSQFCVRILVDMTCVLKMLSYLALAYTCELYDVT